MPSPPVQATVTTIGCCVRRSPRRRAAAFARPRDPDAPQRTLSRRTVWRALPPYTAARNRCVFRRRRSRRRRLACTRVLYAYTITHIYAHATKRSLHVRGFLFSTFLRTPVRRRISRSVRLRCLPRFPRVEFVSHPRSIEFTRFDKSDFTCVDVFSVSTSLCPITRKVYSITVLKQKRKTVKLCSSRTTRISRKTRRGSTVNFPTFVLLSIRRKVLRFQVQPILLNGMPNKPINKDVCPERASLGAIPY